VSKIVQIMTTPRHGKKTASLFHQHLCWNFTAKFNLGFENLYSWYRCAKNCALSFQGKSCTSKFGKNRFLIVKNFDKINKTPELTKLWEQERKIGRGAFKSVKTRACQGYNREIRQQQQQQQQQQQTYIARTFGQK